MKELRGVCKKCVFGCNRLEDENFTGVEKCSYCTLEQIILEQVKIDLDKEGETNDNKNSNAMQKQKK